MPKAQVARKLEIVEIAEDPILSAEEKLDKILANQEEILTNQAEIIEKLNDLGVAQDYRYAERY